MLGHSLALNRCAFSCGANVPMFSTYDMTKLLSLDLTSSVVSSKLTGAVSRERRVRRPRTRFGDGARTVVDVKDNFDAKRTIVLGC